LADPVSFPRTNLTRREAIIFMSGSALSAAVAFFYLSIPKSMPNSPEQQATTTTTHSPEQQATTTTAQNQPSYNGPGGTQPQPGYGGTSYVISSVLATTTLDTELMPERE
jgi:hypothetical protein